MSQVATPDTPVIVNDSTTNYGLPLPDPRNLMPADCMRIRQAIVGLDSELGKIGADAEAALPLAGGAMTGPVSNLMLAGLEALKYDAGAVSGKQVMDFTPQRASFSPPLYLHVNADSPDASDTVDLNAGRGLSEDMPFMTPLAAINWAAAHYTQGIIYITLHSDVTLSGTLSIPSSLSYIRLISDSTKRTVFTSGIKVSFGVFNFASLKFQATSESISAFVAVLGSEGIAGVGIRADCEFHGAVTAATISAAYNGLINLGWWGDIANAFAGSDVTGKRYNCVCGSKIITRTYNVNLFPGTEAGTCDATSVYC